jgi:tetratricopeptide (TPR) repeat protein
MTEQRRPHATGRGAQIAPANRFETRQTVDDFFTQVSEDDLLNQPGMQPLRRELLEQALEYYRHFTVQRGDDPALQDELALTHFRMGRIIELIESPDAALPSYQLALSIQRKLLKETPDDPDRLGGIGDTLNAIGRIFSRRNELDRAREAYKEAAAIRGKLLADDPEQLEFLRKLANSHMNLALVEKMAGNSELAHSQFEKSQTLRRQGLERHPDDPLIRRDLGMGYYNLANLEISMVGGEDSQAGHDLCRDAQENFERSIEVFAGLLRDNPEDMANQHRLVLCCRLLADVKCELEDWSAALKLYCRALEQMQSLAGSNPKVPRYQFSLAGMHMNLGNFWRERGQPEEAAGSFSSALAILRKLVAEYPEETLYRRDLAVTLLEDGELKSDAGLHQQARKVLEEARNFLTTLVDQFPDDPRLKSQLDQAAAAIEEIDSQKAQPRAGS